MPHDRLLAATLALFAVRAGVAGIVVTGDLRATTAWAESWSGGNRSYDAPDTNTHDEFAGSGLIITGAFSSYDGAIASGQAWEDSLIRPGGRIESRGHAVGHTITNDDPNDAQTATLLAEVHYELAFILTTTAEAHFEAWTSGGASVELREIGGAIVFSGGGTFDQVLTAGEYRLLAMAPLFIDSVMVDGAVYDGSDYWVSLTVPSPGVLAGLAALPMLLARRRA